MRPTFTRRVVLAALLALLLALPAAAQRRYVVYQTVSQYQRIVVWDNPDGIHRQMLFDPNFDGADAVQSELNKANPLELCLPYAQYMITSIPLVEKPKHILVIGLGGACIQRYLHEKLPNAVIETAELDPAVLDVAKKFFMLKEDDRQKVHIGDGRKFIENSKDKYDIIMLDAFSATSIPYMLATQEFLNIVKDHLADGGMVCANLWYNQPDYHDMIKTYDSVYPEFHVLRCPDWSNQIVLAFPTKRGLTPEAWMAKCDEFSKTTQTGLKLSQFIDRNVAPVTRVPKSAKILLDANAPK